MTDHLLVKRYRPFMMHDSSAVTAIKSYLGRNGLSLEKSTLHNCKRVNVVAHFKNSACFNSFLKAAATTISLQLMDMYSVPTSGLGEILYHFFRRDTAKDKNGSPSLWGTDPCREYITNRSCFKFGEEVNSLPEEFIEPTRLAVFTTTKDYAKQICAGKQGCLEGLTKYCIDGSDISVDLECDEEVARMLTGHSKVWAENF